MSAYATVVLKPLRNNNVGRWVAMFRCGWRPRVICRNWSLRFRAARFSGNWPVAWTNVCDKKLGRVLNTHHPRSCRGNSRNNLKSFVGVVLGACHILLPAVTIEFCGLVIQYKKLLRQHIAFSRFPNHQRMYFHVLCPSSIAHAEHRAPWIYNETVRAVSRRNIRKVHGRFFREKTSLI